MQREAMSLRSFAQRDELLDALGTLFGELLVQHPTDQQELFVVLLERSYSLCEDFTDDECDCPRSAA